MVPLSSREHLNTTMINTVIIHDAAKGIWLHFANPLEIIRADDIREVLPKLQLTERITYERQCYAAGFISYEAAPAFDSAHKTHLPTSFPLLWFGIYEKPKIIDLQELAMGSYPAPLDWSITTDKNRYIDVIARIKHHIERGETYQVNYTIRQSAQYSGDPWSLFLNIARNAPYGAFLETDDYAICSASPELFFELHRGRLTSRPMKGTAPRGRTNEEDQKLRELLYKSEKDRAENVMIVDMMRNDIGRVAATGSVNVPKLFETEKYPTVWQMTSTVTAKTDAPISEIVTALFPCASITGTPKVNTMKIIADIEDTNRNIYTGSIGYITPDNDAQFNVAIRTALINKKQNRIEYGTGGGIVWDSVDTLEYEECLLKAKIVNEPQPDTSFSLLETILWTPQDGYFLLRYHLDRMRDSAKYFDFPYDADDIQNELKSAAASFRDTDYKVRLLLARNEAITCQCEPLHSSTAATLKRVQIAQKPVDSANPFLFHKTTNRRVYDSARAEFPDCDDVLLWNEKGEVTESCLSNVVIRCNGKLITPPVQCGLLNGTYRSYLLEQNKIVERTISLEEIKKATQIYLINSVRKWQKVHLQHTDAKLPLEGL